MGLRDDLAHRLERTRQRTLALYAELSDGDIVRAPEPIMSPPVWDLGHIGAYEELWVACTLDRRRPRYPDLQSVYDAFETPRDRRTEVPLLDRTACEAYLRDVRADSLDVLARTPLDDGNALARDGFVFDLVAQHEAQHTETVLQTLQMFTHDEYRPRRSAQSELIGRTAARRRVAIPAGPVAIGTDRRGFSYDCERPSHTVELRAFEIAESPVTNHEHLEFMADDGYRRPELWSADGWEWRARGGVDAPLYWEADGAGGYLTRSFDRREPVDPAHPVCHVSYWEAEAHARWAGARLPTECEWERAAAGACVDGAALDQLDFGTTAVGASAGGRSSCGCVDMIGNVWEWTSSRFGPYPGFSVDPYPEYSQVFFGGDYRVLRGGSWATQPVAARTTFRNWDHPYRRQIFAGLRLAWDVTA